MILATPFMAELLVNVHDVIVIVILPVIIEST